MASAVRMSRGSDAGSSPNGTASESAVMSSVGECSIRKSGSSVQKPRSFDSRRALRKRPDSGSKSPGLLSRLVATAGQDSLDSRSDRQRRPSALSIHRARASAANRAAARRPATTHAFE